MNALDPLKAHFVQSFALFQKHWKALALTLLLAWVPLWLVTLAATFSFDLFTGFLLDRNGLGALGGLFGLLLALVARLGVSLLVELPLFFLACALSQGLTVVQILAIERGSVLSPLDAWRDLRPNLGKLLVTSALSVATITLGLFFFLVPGAIAAMYFQLAAPLTILEGRSGLDALKASVSLIRSAPRSFLVVLIGTGILSSLAQIFTAMLLPSSLELLGSNLAFMAFYPLQGMILVALYREARAPQTPDETAAVDPVPVA